MNYMINFVHMGNFLPTESMQIYKPGNCGFAKFSRIFGGGKGHSKN